MNEQKMREEFESWCCSPCNTDHASKFAWKAWQAACASKQREIDALEAQLREQHQNQLDLMEKLPINPEEVYSPHTKVIE